MLERSILNLYCAYTNDNINQVKGQRPGQLTGKFHTQKGFEVIPISWNKLYTLELSISNEHLVFLLYIH